MSLLGKLCKELGVKIGEEWTGSDGKTYIIENECIIEYYDPDVNSDTDYESWVMSEYEVYAKILQGKLVPMWNPKRKDEVYTICFLKRDYIYSFPWLGTPCEQNMLEKGLVFKTKEEAMDCANKMVKSIK